jgi:hypothetical protein
MSLFLLSEIIRRVNFNCGVSVKYAHSSPPNSFSDPKSVLLIDPNAKGQKINPYRCVQTKINGHVKNESYFLIYPDL